MKPFKILSLVIVIATVLTVSNFAPAAINAQDPEDRSPDYPVWDAGPDVPDWLVGRLKKPEDFVDLATFEPPSEPGPAQLPFELLEGDKANADWTLAKAAEPYKGTTVSLYNVAGYEFNAILPKFLPEFEEATGIKVEVDMVTYGEAVEKHLSLLATGSDRYDLYNIDSIWFPQYQPFLDPLTAGMKNPDLYNPNFDYYDLVHETQWTNSWEGEPYQFSCMYTFPGNYYREDYFEEAGYNKADYPRTWEEWHEYSKNLTENLTTANDGNQVYGETIHGLRTAMMEIVTSRYLAAGGNMFDDYLHPTLNNELLMKYLGDIQNEYENGYTPPGSLDFELGEAAASYQQGNTAMCWNWLITVAWVEDPEQSKAAGKSGYFLPPISTRDGKPTPGGVTRLASFGQAIASTAKNKEAAYLLAQWIADPEIQARITEAGDSAPSRYSILWGALKDRYPHFWMLRTAGVLGYLWNCPKIPNEAQWEDTIAVEFQKCMIGEQSPEDAAKSAEDKAWKLMKDYGYYEEGKTYPVEMTANVQGWPCEDSKSGLWTCPKE